MIRVISKPADLPPLERVLCIYQLTLIHPRWEMLVAGDLVNHIQIRKQPLIRQALLWKSYVQYSRANPRDAEYMFNLSCEFAGQYGIKAVDLLVPSTLSKQFPEGFPVIFRKVWAVNANPYLQLNQVRDDLKSIGYDALVLLYPDAIGLGWGRIERALKPLGVPIVLVVNGRKRTFILDKSSRLALKWRRFLEYIWLVEILLAATLSVVSLPLAIYDAVEKAIRSFTGKEKVAHE